MFQMLQLQLLSALLLQVTLGGLTLTVLPSNQIAGQSTDHTLQIYFKDQTILAGSKLVIEYTSQWDISSVSGGATEDFCENSCNLGSITTAVVGLTVQLSNFFTSGVSKPFIIQYTLKNIRNPILVNDYDILIYLNDNLGFPQNLNIDKTSIEPAQFSCTLTRTVLQVSEPSDYTFTVDISGSSLTLPANAQVVITFPDLWFNSAVGQTYDSAISTCTSASSSTISCSIISQRQIKASNVLTSPSNTQFQFTLTSVINPGSLQSNRQMFLQFYGARLMGFCGIQISGNTAKSITDLSFNLLKNELAQHSLVQLVFTLPVAPKNTDSVRVTFPIEYGLEYLKVATKRINSQSTTISFEVDIISSSATENELQMFPFSVQTLVTYTLTLYQLILPLSSKSINPINVGIYRYGYLVAEATCCSKTLNTLSSGTLNIELQDSKVGISTDYRIKVSSIKVFGYSQLVVVFDGTYVLTQSSYTCSMSGLESVLTPTCSRITSNTIKVAGISQISQFETQNFIISISGITNPVTIDTLTLVVKTQDSDENDIQKIEGTYSLASTLINSVSIVVASSTTYATSSYQFSIFNANNIPINSEVKIIFPPEFILTAQTKCYKGASLQTSATVDLGQSYVIVPLKNSAVIAPNILTNTKIIISDIKNPATIKQSKSFTIEISESGNVLESKSKGVTVMISNAESSFGSLNINADDLTTYKESNYQFQYQLSLDVMSMYSTGTYTLGFIQIDLPADFSLVSCSACTMTSPLIIPISLSTLTNTLDNIVIRNPSMKTISSDIIVSLYIDGHLSIKHEYSGLQTFNAYNIQYSISGHNTYYSEESSQQISITGPIYDFIDYILISVPSQFQIRGSGGLLVSTDYPSPILNLVSTGSTLQKIRISGLPYLSSLLINIVGLVNPGSIGATSWLIEFYSSSNVLIGQSTSSNIFTFQCNVPCRSCTQNDASHCLSCYTGGFQYLSGSTCVASCTTHQFQISKTCYQCDVSCEKCINKQNHCTECPTGKFILNNVCMSQCPLQFYADSLTKSCLQCTSPCLFCTSSICLYCESTHVLTSTGTCQTSCPGQSYNKSNICIDCDNNCATCDPTGCLTCKTNTYLYEKLCLSDCPKGLFPENVGNICESCKAPCLTCETSSTICTSCDTLSANPYLHGSNCVPSCPNNKYADQYKICHQCISPCASCTSPISCKSCIPDYKLYKETDQCLQNCPFNTLEIGSQCQKCTSPCLQCQTSPTICTSCIQEYFLDGNNCGLTCTPPQYAIDRKCRRCAEPCDTCISNKPYSCTTCISDYYLLGQSCYQNCPPGTLSSGTSCVVCTSGCKECSGTSSTCSSCVSGLFLYEKACINDCPTTPKLYYAYQRQCIECQPQCFTCLASPIQCSACSSSALFFNLETRTCTSTCEKPYFEGFYKGSKACIRCKLPCSVCTDSATTCSSCVNNYYLHNGRCLETCPDQFYPDSFLNQCKSCLQNCLACKQEEFCLTCKTGFRIFKGVCYSECPSEAQYPYLQIYCRNCEKDHCLLCNDDNECVLCQSGYFNHEDKCIENCPEGYEPDAVTQTMCVVTHISALQTYAKFQQRYKTLVLPGSTILIITFPILLYYSYSKLIMLVIIISLPQFVAYAHYLVNILLYPQIYLSVVPFYIVPILVGIFVILNVLACVYLAVKLPQDLLFEQWMDYGKNRKRFWSLLIFSMLISQKLIYLIFSGFAKLPITCCQVSRFTIDLVFKRIKVFHILTIVLVQLPLIAYPIYALITEKYEIMNSKLFYAGIDAAATSLLSIVLTIILLVKNFEVPHPYQKYIIEKISNLSLPALSEKLPEVEVDEDEGRMLHHSNSAENIKKSEEMERVEFNSVFDTDQYEDPPEFDDIEGAINIGKYRKKNLKKKKKDRFGIGLQVIEENEDEDEVEEIKLKKKKKPMKKVKLGYMNNFIYWKPPEKKEDPKEKAMKEIKLHGNEIMDKIKEKQSEFDTLTKNDILFQEQPQQYRYSSDDSDDFDIQPSKRPLNNRYETYINKNYANRRHLEDL